MGMYTGLRVKAKIKQEFIPELEAVFRTRDTGKWDAPWSEVDFSKFPFVEKFSKLGRSSMIPWGAMTYMPSDWEHTNVLENGVWVFCCSLKNYEDEIEIFLNEVLVNIAEWADIERLYEEESVSALLSVENGVLRTVRESKWDY